MSRYIDNVVIRLKRQYSKDELVQYMIKEHKELQLKNNILKNEKHELLCELDQIRKMDNETKENFRKTFYVKNIRKELDFVIQKCKKLERENEKLWFIATQVNAK